jgi:hypothetical protein
VTQYADFTKNSIQDRNETIVFPSSIFKKAVHAKQRYVQTYFTKIFPERTVNVEITERKSLRSLIKECVSLDRYFRKSYLMSSIMLQSNVSITAQNLFFLSW